MREAGTSMVELIVALALISVVFLAAGPLIVQSTRIFTSAGMKLTDPNSVLLEAWMRHDIHSASAVVASPQPKGVENLLLVMPDGRRISYGLEESALIRKDFSPKGKLIGRHLVLPRLMSWDWSVIQGCVMVQLELPSHLDPSRAALFPKPKGLRAVERKTVDFCFSLRGRGGMSW